jgi:hypothetical protein
LYSTRRPSKSVASDPASASTSDTRPVFPLNTSLS